MNILELKERQIIEIKGEQYRVANMTKFVEKSSYWIEYKLQSISSGEWYYLNVELTEKAVLYEILPDKTFELGFNVFFQGEEFSLIEKGQGIVDTYFGMTDVAVGDVDEYFEYESKTSNKILSIEKWNNQTEISIGVPIKKSEIKLLNEYDY